ncbi:hypothetical protein QYE76_006137 [Lolium multiflorum]|uniref:NB-ARC domain-containing protein n=1 Tax=Lolium multiflorum TaxID=4521 RepID=A0AAD8RVS9_LOLMU|nr:hypothetical protein QYE76_006137 [Lolium multiflorum]
MAITALEVAWAGWVITVVGWLLSPIITLLLPKILSNLGFDASKKLRELEMHIIPELHNTLCAVDQERMLERGKKVNSGVAVLDKMAAMLRHARDEAEDVFDAQQEIESRRSRSCWDILCAACNSSCVWVARIVSARVRTPEEPVLLNTSTSDETIAVTIDIAASTATCHEQAVAVATPSDSASHEAVPVAAAPSDSWRSNLEVFKNRCRSTFYCLADGFEAACFYRNWSYEVIGVTSYPENTNPLDFLATAISRRSLKIRIEKIESTIDEVKKSPLLGEASKSAPQDIANKNRSRIRTTSNRKVFGREAFRDSVMEKLRENPHGTGPCYSVIGIYGVAGSGKTTFAQYTRDRIEEEKLFDTIISIHVSENFSVDDIFHEMLKDITKDRHSNISDREELEEKLKESLRGKLFCLILDDLWVKTKNDPQLEELISPLNVGVKGSKILVTARTKVAAGALCAGEPMEMPGLDEHAYLSMFMHYALGGTVVTDEEFERVGRVISEKLHGSPIAAVIVGGRLGSNRDINFWKYTAECDMLNDTMDAIWWSYRQLSLDIKRCFEYCNIFPRRFKIKKGDLVHLWIAQGFVKTTCAREDMEDVAEGYIHELVSCSFLQQGKTWYNGKFFRIHDLLHDLIDMITTRTDCFRIENESSQRGETWKGDIPRDTRHLFIQNYDTELITEKALPLANLRTLIIHLVGRDTQIEENIIDNICKKLPKLRVLGVANQTYGSIGKPQSFFVPDSIGQLKCLRYLAFRTDLFCTITLPSTLNKLQHIQLLDFGEGSIRKFNFAKLVNLRHIFCWKVVEVPVG